MPIAFHTVIALVDRRVIATNQAQRRAYARIVSRIGEKYGLLAHGMPDNHGHLVTVCERERAGACARAIETALQHLLPIEVPFAPAYFKPVANQSHLRSVIPYVHRQVAHHGVTVDPCGDASSLQDLLGVRFIGGDYLRARLAAHAPRIEPTQLIPESLRAREMPTPTIEQAVEAAAAVIGEVALRGQRTAVIHARRAALAIGSPAGRERRAAALGCSPRTVSRLLADPALPPWVEAAAMQADWRFGAEATSPIAERASGRARAGWGAKASSPSWPQR